MGALRTTIYVSRATSSFDAPSLRDLLTRSRLRNGVAGVSGMLLYDRGSFFQVLEGEPSAVQQVLDRIRADSRHEGVVVLVDEPITTRGFAAWTMGFADVSPDRLAREPGFDDVFAPGSPRLASIASGVARGLATAFRDGRLRTSIG